MSREMVLPIKLHNRFDVERVDAKTGKLKQRAYAENIILNQAWTHILNIASIYNGGTDSNTFGWFGYIGYGTGTGTLAATRTELFTPLSYKEVTTQEYAQDLSAGYYSLRRKITLTELEHVGAVLSEVGIREHVTSSNRYLCTHALLKDMNGNPVTITKTDTDIIYIYATVYLVIPVWDKDAAIAFKPVDGGSNILVTTLLGRMQKVYYSSAYSFYAMPNRLVFRKATDAPPVYGVTPIEAPYVFDSGSDITPTKDVANKRIQWYYRLAAANGNSNGPIKSASLYFNHASSGNNRPAILLRWPSTNHTQSTIIEQIGTGDGSTIDFATTYPFVKSGAVIKADGLAVSATVHTGLPNQKDIAPYLRNLGTNGDGLRHARDWTPSYYAYGAQTILENPFYATHGIDEISVSNCTVWVSNDMVSWTQISNGAVASEHKQKRYWKLINTSTLYRLVYAYCNALDAYKNVSLATAPATGTVITAEYNTDVVRKDANHVVDITVTLQLAEYTP